MAGWEQDGGDEKCMRLGAEAGGQKIKPCPPHLLSCSGGGSWDKFEWGGLCVCVCGVYVHTGERVPCGAFCAQMKQIKKKNTPPSDDVTNKPHGRYCFEVFFSSQSLKRSQFST